jgi:hypothetical protein
MEGIPDACDCNFLKGMVIKTYENVYTYFSGIKIYNCLPTRIKLLSGDVNKFKLALKIFLLAGSFYSIEEFLHWSTLRPKCHVFMMIVGLAGLSTLFNLILF